MSHKLVEPSSQEANANTLANSLTKPLTSSTSWSSRLLSSAFKPSHSLLALAPRSQKWLPTSRNLPESLHTQLLLQQTQDLTSFNLTTVVFYDNNHTITICLDNRVRHDNTNVFNWPTLTDMYCLRYCTVVFICRLYQECTLCNMRVCDHGFSYLAFLYGVMKNPM